jgi:3-oxoacyl-[acyl-carrier-protein] synthase II
VTRRVGITGIGPISAIGIGREAFWDGLRRCRSGVGALTRFAAPESQSRVAGQVDDFNPSQHLSPRQNRRLDRYSQFAVAAARLALDDAGLRDAELSRERTGVYVGSALGGIAFAEEQHSKFETAGAAAISPLLALSVFGGAASCNIAIQLDVRGPNMANSNSCASGCIALGEAFHLIRAGAADVMLSGGVEVPLAPLTFQSFGTIRALSTRNEDAATASRPFDATRDGFVMAEAAALLVLEELEHARARGARVYAELRGYGTTNDAYHMTAPRPDGEAAARAVCIALEDAGIPADALDYVNAHASSTPLGDRIEARALQIALGAHASRVLTSATKGYYGHPLGASGALEAAICALAIHREWVPPTLNLEEPEAGLDLSFVRGSGCHTAPRCALNTSFGFGGINASLVLSSVGAT